MKPAFVCEVSTSQVADEAATAGAAPEVEVSLFVFM